MRAVWARMICSRISSRRRFQWDVGWILLRDQWLDVETVTKGWHGSRLRRSMRRGGSGEVRERLRGVEKEAREEKRSRYPARNEQALPLFIL